MHFDSRHCFPGLERIVKRLKHLLCTGPAWPLPHSWATTFLWGSLRIGDLSRTCRACKLGVCLAPHRASRLEFWPGFIEFQRPGRGLGPSCTPGLAETPPHYHHLIQSCQIDDKVLPSGGHQQHSLPSPGQFPAPPTAPAHLSEGIRPLSLRESGWLVAGLWAPLRPPARLRAWGA